MAPVILHCDMNNYYASVEALLNPALRGKPLAVCGDLRERHGICLAKSQEAKAAGVKTGDPLFEVRRKCPGILIERLLLVDFVDAQGKPKGEVHVAADTIGAGNGEWVLVTQGSSARRASPDGDSLPIDMSIVGIVDEVVIEGRLAYHK